MDKKIMVEVGKRIREVRNHLQLNQTDFAGHLDMPVKQLSAMENGKIKPDFDFLYKAEEVFNVNLSYIITGKGTILPLWERPTIKMCEILLKEKGHEFRELIQEMYKSDGLCRAVIDHFLLYRLQISDWIEANKLITKKETEPDEE
jgi:transcriptional regulator with XRE-family HTH domain